MKISIASSIWLISAVMLGFSFARVPSGMAASFVYTGNLVDDHIFHQATLLTNGQVLVSGGQDYLSIYYWLGTYASELYDPILAVWTGTGSMNDARYYHTSTLLPNGQVLVAGGSELPISAFSTAEIFDPASGTWSRTGNMNTPRALHTATLLPDGNVLVAGGSTSSSSFEPTYPATEEYNPTTGQWTATGPLQWYRAEHTATLLTNGLVLIAGGNVGQSIGPTVAAELYDPATSTTTRTGNLNIARQIHTATLLLNGKVLVAGGWNKNGYLSSCELYDPASGTWTNTGRMNNARAYHSAALLTNGYVLVVGGVNSSSYNTLSSAEIYDPTAGVWKMTASMNSVRFGSTATPLTNGQILIAAGGNAQLNWSFSNPYWTAELYDFWAPTPPCIISQPSSQTNFSGATVMFTVNVTFPPTVNFQWEMDGTNIFDGGPLSGTATNTLTITGISENDAGNYSVIVTNTYGSVTSYLATLTVVRPPTITAQPTNQTVVLGNSASFSVAISGTPPCAYNWQFNSNSIADATNASLAFNNVQFSNVGTYQVIVTNIYGSVTSSVATLTVVSSPVITSQATNQTVVIGNNAAFSVAVCGVSPLAYQWYFILFTNLQTPIITTISGNGHSSFSGDGGVATNASLYMPYGVVVDGSGNVFIADTYNNRIRKVATNGIITTVVGNGSSPPLSYPYGVTLDGAGNLFLSDSGNCRIRKLATNGLITTVAGNGKYGYSGDGGSATNAELNNPIGVAVDVNGNLFIGDAGNNNVRKVAVNGIITTVAGNGAAGFSGDGGVATSAALYSPSGIAVDASGNLFIADCINSRIRRVGTNGIITTVAGNGNSGYSGDC